MTESNKLEYAEKNAMVNGIRLTYFESGLAFRTQKPTLLFLHATGFHARVWDKIVNGLGDYHIVAVDQRGHGRSEKRMIQHWHEFTADIEALIEHLDLTDIVGIGHSMGAHTLIGAASTLQHRFNRLIAIDPVIPDESAFQEPVVDSTQPEEKHPAARRRREFDSPEAMAERLIDKGSYRVSIRRYSEIIVSMAFFQILRVRATCLLALQKSKQAYTCQADQMERFTRLCAASTSLYWS